MFRQFNRLLHMVRVDLKSVPNNNQVSLLIMFLTFFFISLQRAHIFL